MPRPKTKSDDALLDAAERVLRRKGPHDFTLADVAREAGLSAPTLVQRFGSKRGLLVAFARRAAGAGARPLASTEPGLRALRAGLVAEARDFGGREELVHHLALLLEDVRDDELRSFAAKHAREVEASIAAHLRAARARGEIDCKPSFARVVQAAWNGAIVLWALRGEGPLDLFVRDTLDALFRSVAPKRRARK